MTIAEKLEKDFGKEVVDRVRISDVCLLKNHCSECKFEEDSLHVCISKALEAEYVEGGTECRK